MFQVLMIVEIILSVYSTNSSSDLSYDAALKLLDLKECQPVIEQRDTKNVMLQVM